MEAQRSWAPLRRVHQGDMDTLIEVFDESIIWPLSAGRRDRPRLRGPRRYLAYFGQLPPRRRHLPAELRAPLPIDEAAFSASSAASRTRNGKHLDVDNCIVFLIQRTAGFLTVRPSRASPRTSLASPAGADPAADRRARADVRESVHVTIWPCQPWGRSRSRPRSSPASCRRRWRSSTARCDPSRRR